MNTTKNNKHDNTVRHLRALLPDRPMHVWEAKRVAEIQAYRMRILLGDLSPNFDTDHIANLPRIDVTTTKDLSASGSTHWQNGAWRIQINQTEALVRQRFTLAHEFKHVLDTPALTTAYCHIREQFDGEHQIEQICDYFAACLLMPKRWVKRLWGEGIRDLEQLADAFEVSQVAMKRRLEDIGLIDRRNFHRPARQSTDPDWFRSAGLPHRPRYRRSHHHLQEAA